MHALTMLAYVFWHRPAAGTGAAEYEAGLAAFHAALAEHPPAGFVGSAAFRIESAPWFAGPAYEDWYAVDGWDALGRLNEAAVQPPLGAPHDAVAAQAGPGAGGVYRLLSGEPATTVAHAAWLSRPAGVERAGFHAALAATGASVWMRQLVLGPAPEYAVRSPSPVELPWPATAVELALVTA